MRAPTLATWTTTLTFCAALVCVEVEAIVNPLVDVDNTRYLGTALPNGVTQWLGMRFAAPPLDDLRFRAPADPPHNSSVQVADEHGPVCLSTGTAFPAAGESEDCLFLDVYAPTAAPAWGLHPVFFFIQGGGFNSDSNPNFNGSGLIAAADMDLVIVTFNYRVGPYGFLASEEVQRNGDINAGMLDQRKALEWVHAHIYKFGGDPGHVVLGGDSAGAESITLHLIAFDARPTDLFHAVIAESQSFPTTLTVPQAQFQYDALVARVGCADETDTLACLRATDISILQGNNSVIPFPGRQNPPNYLYNAIVDGKLLTGFPYNLFMRGKFIKVPSVFGDDTNEGTIFTPTNLNTTSDMDNFLLDNFPNMTTSMISTVNKFYPKSSQFPGHGAFYFAAATAYGEMRYICPGIFISGQIDKFRGLLPNWYYHYNVTDPAQVANGLGVPHTVELNAIWGPDNTNGGAPASYLTTNAAIIPVMQGYWTSFIRTFDPNTFRAAGTPVWEPFTFAQKRILFETNATRMETVPPDQTERCDFLKSIALNKGMMNKSEKDALHEHGRSYVASHCASKQHSTSAARQPRQRTSASSAVKTKDMWLTDAQKIGVALTSFGALFMLLGVILFFDAVCSLWETYVYTLYFVLLSFLRVFTTTSSRTRVLFLSGITLIIGPHKTFYFFARRQKLRGTLCFLGGILLVFLKWPFIGVIVETFGFLNLFGDFFPVILTFLRQLPFIGTLLSLPYIRNVADRIAGSRQSVV